MKNRDPIGFNKQIFGDAEGVDEVQPSMRMLIGGGFGGHRGDKSLLQLHRRRPRSHGSNPCRNGNWARTCFRYDPRGKDQIHGPQPSPPMVIFPGLILLCIYSALG